MTQQVNNIHPQVATSRPLGYERVYLPLYKVVYTPFHIQGNEVIVTAILLYKNKMHYLLTCKVRRYCILNENEIE